MSETLCEVCKAPKAGFTCGICHKELCKKCVEFNELDNFSFMSKIPEEISHPHYCAYCFLDKIPQAREAYQEMVNRAKEVFVFDNPRFRLPQVKSVSKRPFLIQQCKDREEALLRLAFLAAEQDYNAVIKVNIAYEKVRSPQGYQTTLWNGTGFGAKIDASKVENRNSR